MAAVVALPVLLGILFRVSAVYIFVSIAVGELLVRFVGDDAGLVAAGFIKGQNGPTVALVAVILIHLILTIIFMKGSVARSKLLLEIVPLVALGSMLLVFVLALLPSSIQQQIFATKPGGILKNSQDLIVAGTGIVILVCMWLTSRPHKAHHGKHHK